MNPCGKVRVIVPFILSEVLVDDNSTGWKTLMRVILKILVSKFVLANLFSHGVYITIFLESLCEKTLIGLNRLVNLFKARSDLFHD